MRPKFFEGPEELRRWFEAYGTTESELWIGYYKKDTGRAGLTYAQAVDESLCFGWIDGQVRRIDAVSYTNRFTPRRPQSIWSLRNVRRVGELQRAGRMRPAGLRAFRARTPERTGVYEFERRAVTPARLDELSRRVFAADRPAFAFFEAQPPGYRRNFVRWIMAARRPETRERRLQAVIAASRAGRRVDPLRPYGNRPRE
ncbi:MAG: YdeI/OmpD-associated family protein [Thermoplasmata archaeon]|nr:YdeI/OmpD-associated family protein [Thermoplasmata archaeon]MCI4355429.1 YdeI/OmpD-associated family protein [Thermoplasmata archaeon]